MIWRMQTRAYVDVGAGVGVDVGAGVGVEVGAGVGVDVGAGVGVDVGAGVGVDVGAGVGVDVGAGVGLRTNNKRLHVSKVPDRLAWRHIDAPWRRRWGWRGCRRGIEHDR